MCQLLQDIRIPGLEVFVEPRCAEHRFVSSVPWATTSATKHGPDPQQTGAAPLTARGADAASQCIADAVSRFAARPARAERASADQHW